MRDLVGDARSGRQAHQPQVLSHLLIVHDFQEGRLFKLYCQPLAKRPVKDGVACRVRDISEDNRVFVRECWRALKVDVTCDEERQRSRRRRSNDRLPAFGDGWCDAGLRTCCHPRQPPQVDDQFTCGLIAFGGIFFEGLLDHIPEADGQVQRIPPMAAPAG